MSQKFTQVPNFLIDEFMAKLSHSEFKLIMLILRLTAGFHRQEAAISFKQFETQTGVTEKWSRECIKKFEKLGWIKVIHGNHKTRNVYKIMMSEESKSKEFFSSTSGTHYPRVVATPGYSLPEGRVFTTVGVGYSLPTTNKVLKETNKEVSVADEPAPAPVAPVSASPLLKITYKGKDGMQVLDPNDVILRAIKERKDWDTKEISQAMKILSESKAIVFDAFRFIEGTIENIRRETKSENIKQSRSDLKCGVKKKSKNELEKSLEKDTKTPVCPNSYNLAEALRSKGLIRD